MSLTTAENFTKRIDTDIAVALSKIDAAEKRGHFLHDEMDDLDALLWSRLPVSATAFQLAAEHAGKRVRERSHLFPNALKAKGLHFSNEAGRASIFIYGPIGSHSGISAADFRAQLAQLRPNQSFDLHVHSPGGSFSEGVAIHSLIHNHLGAVSGFVDSSACSAASLLLMPCTTITMAVASELMIHNASLSSEGDWSEEDLARAHKMMKNTNNKLVELYSPRWKGTEKELRDALAAETFFTPAEAVEHGLADHISGSVKAASYQVVTGAHRSPTFSIAASAGPHKNFGMRRAELRLWQLEADDMRRELGIN